MSAVPANGLMIYDIAVLGAGVSGASAAIALAKSGWRVALLGGHVNDLAIDRAETLSSAARPWLEYLGVWSDYQQIGVLPLSASESTWRGISYIKSDLHSPYGVDWIIPKARFVRLLQEHALMGGAKVYWSSWNRVCQRVLNRGKTIYDLYLEGLFLPLQAYAIIDASGHSASAARQLGAKRTCFGYQTAQIWRINIHDISSKPWSATYSHQTGWVYAATCALGGYSVSLYSVPYKERAFKSKALDFKRSIGAESNIQLEEVFSLLQNKMQISSLKNCLNGHNPVIHSATSSKLWPVANKTWVAIGDAACTLDPLSSTGLLQAIRSACRGAQAISNSLQENYCELSDYSHMTRAFVDQYSLERSLIYSK